MPAIQTTYSSDYAPGLPGMVANQETRNVVSLTVQDASLPFGSAVFQGATNDTVTATPGTLFRGISIIDRSVSQYDPKLPRTPDTYAQLDTAAVLTFGVVWVTASVAVAAGEPVYVTAAGLFTDAATGDTALPRATFDIGAAAGSLVKIRLA